MSSSTFGLDSLRGEHQAVCSWKCFCGLARCLSALPGTRPQWGLGLKSGSGLEALSELAAPPWSKMSRRPTWLVVSCNWYITIAALEGEKRKLRCVWVCGDETGKHRTVEKKERRERERGANGNVGQILQLQRLFWLKIWNSDCNMASRGFGKQRRTYQVENTVSDICAVLDRVRVGKECRVRGDAVFRKPFSRPFFKGPSCAPWRSWAVTVAESAQWGQAGASESG